MLAFCTHFAIKAVSGNNSVSAGGRTQISIPAKHLSLHFLLTTFYPSTRERKYYSRSYSIEIGDTLPRVIWIHKLDQ
jgi:hypothetical protein